MKQKNKPVREIIPKRPATITGREFVKLLRSLPHPDKEYLDEVEQFVSKSAARRDITTMAALNVRSM
jgi:hypothetical protein